MEYKVCNSEELPNNSMKVITIQGSNILVCRSNNRLFALDNSCPHRGASLSKGEIKGTRIICYMHDFEYDLIGQDLIMCYCFQYRKKMVKFTSSYSINIY